MNALPLVMTSVQPLVEALLLDEQSVKSGSGTVRPVPSGDSPPILAVTACTLLCIQGWSVEGCGPSRASEEKDQDAAEA